MMNRDSASLKTIKTVSPFSQEPTETQFFVHKRARYMDFDKVDDDGSLVELKTKNKLKLICDSKTLSKNSPKFRIKTYVPAVTKSIFRDRSCCNFWRNFSFSFCNASICNFI